MSLGFAFRFLCCLHLGGDESGEERVELVKWFRGGVELEARKWDVTLQNCRSRLLKRAACPSAHREGRGRRESPLGADEAKGAFLASSGFS